MRRNKVFLYSGLITVAVEWLGLLTSLAYTHRLDPNKALSTSTQAPWPVPLIFGLTLTIAGLSYAIFSFALKPYSKWIPFWAIVAGFAFMMTGWTPYSGYGGRADLIHQFFSYVALMGYVIMIWLLRAHPRRHIRVSSTTVACLIIGATGFAAISHFALGRYFAYAQLLILLLIQTWTVYVIWNERKRFLVDNPS